ncbi:hypothetical protein RCH08_005207 [Janthinobacterium sp. CG_S6]|nr:hypothetical protein [Janthinobacterium sp. CG_S6]
MLTSLEGVGGGRGRQFGRKIRRQALARQVVEAAVQPGRRRQRRKQVGKMARRVGAAQQQQAVALERVVEQRNQALLQLGVQVDQQVAAAQDVELGKRRVRNDVLLGEDDHVADLLLDVVAVLFRHEKMLQPLGRDVVGDGRREAAQAGAVDGVARQVGGEDLQRVFRRRVDVGHHLVEHHRQRIGFLAGRAGRYPGLERAPPGVGRQQLRQRHRLQVFPHLLVAEETGHADQHFLEQQVDLGRVLAQVGHVALHRRDLVQTHTPLDAPQHRVDLVVGEAVAGMLAKQLDDLVQRVLAAVLVAGQVQEAAEQVGDDLFRHFLRHVDQVDDLGADGAGRHILELGRIGELRQRQPVAFLDRLQAAGAVAAHAGKDHADRQFAALGRQGGEKQVDRQAVAALLGRLGQQQAAVGDAQVGVWRDDVDAVRPHLHPVGDLRHRQAGGALQQLRQHRLVGRVEVLDDDVGDAAVLRHVGEEGDDGVESAGRGADGDDREQRARRRLGTFQRARFDRLRAGVDAPGRHRGTKSETGILGT